MLKSYRSTYEISTFTQNISKNKNFVAIERHGKEPDVLVFNSAMEEIKQIISWINDFKDFPDHQSLGIICKTSMQAEELYNQLIKETLNIQLITSESSAFSQGVVVTTAHTVKGLEFDRVIVPHANDKNYNTQMDKGMLYVACTRAMHRLHICCTNKISHFLTFGKLSLTDISTFTQILQIQILFIFKMQQRQMLRFIMLQVK